MAELLLWTNGVGARSVWLQERATVEPSSNVTSQSYLGVRMPFQMLQLSSPTIADVASNVTRRRILVVMDNKDAVRTRAGTIPALMVVRQRIHSLLSS